METSQQVWTALQTHFSTQSRSRISHLKHQLQALTQGTKSCSEYLENAKHLADQLARAGKPVDDQDLISFLLSGLPFTYTPFVTSFNFASRDIDFTFEDFQAELLGHENLLNFNHSSCVTDHNHFVFAAHKSKAPICGRKKGPPLHSTKLQYVISSTSRPHQQTRSPTLQLSSNHPVCQICGKIGHTAIDCFHHFDYSYQGRFPPQDLAAMMAKDNATLDHQVWYMNSGVNAHITSSATNLTHQNSCHDSSTVTVGNGSDLQILNTGSTTFNLGKSNFHLNNILHCPQAATNLIYINRFCLDNNCYFILTATDFIVKENLIGKILLRGVVDNELYPLAGCQNSL